MQVSVRGGVDIQLAQLQDHEHEHAKHGGECNAHENEEDALHTQSTAAARLGRRTRGACEALVAEALRRVRVRVEAAHAVGVADLGVSHARGGASRNCGQRHLVRALIVLHYKRTRRV